MLVYGAMTSRSTSKCFTFFHNLCISEVIKIGCEYDHHQVLPIQCRHTTCILIIIIVQCQVNDTIILQLLFEYYGKPCTMYCVAHQTRTRRTRRTVPCNDHVVVL